MSKARRSPIDYKPQFGDAFFRPADIIESELAALDDPASITGTDDADAERSNERTNGRSDERTNDRSAVRTNQRTTGRTTGRTNERPGVADARVDSPPPAERLRVRHSFDVYHDQLLALAAIQAERFRTTTRKPKIGELVQEAIDAFIRTNERTNDRSRR